MSYYNADGVDLSVADTLATMSFVSAQHEQNANAIELLVSIINSALQNLSTAAIAASLSTLTSLDTYIKEMQVCLQNGQWYEQGQCTSPEIPVFQDAISFNYARPE